MRLLVAAAAAAATTLLSVRVQVYYTLCRWCQLRTHTLASNVQYTPPVPSSDSESSPERASLPEVGERIRARRQSLDMSVRELARRLTLSPSLISQIERGKATPSVATLYAITTELKMSLDELFSEQAPKAAASRAGRWADGLRGRPTPPTGSRCSMPSCAPTATRAPWSPAGRWSRPTSAR